MWRYGSRLHAIRPTRLKEEFSKVLRATARPLHGFQAYTSALTRLADVLCVIGAGWVAYWLRFGDSQISSGSYTSALVVGALLVLIIHPVFGIYRSWRGSLRLGLIAKLVAAYMMVGAAITTLLFFTQSGGIFSRLIREINRNKKK
ncbi:hypothetical protein FG147_02725 [Thauera sp. UPWRP]|nr:hypothetical protein FG147_02725 [Thauera sp. UPWRP]